MTTTSPPSSPSSARPTNTNHDNTRRRRRGNRWGHSSSTTTNNNNNATTKTYPSSSSSNNNVTTATTNISDQDALQALLNSVRPQQQESQSHQKQSHQKQSQQQQQHRRHSQGQDPKLHYYGPHSNNNHNHNNNNNNNNNNHNHNLKRSREYGENHHSRGTTSTTSTHPPSHPNPPQHASTNDPNPPTDNDTTASSSSQNSPRSNHHKKQKPNFGVSGALAQDEHQGNMYKGVLLKFREPPEARAPNVQWRLYVFRSTTPGSTTTTTTATTVPPHKKEEDNAAQPQLLDTLHISKQSAYLIGRHEVVADIHVTHASISSQHAVLQYRAVPLSTNASSSGNAAPTLSCQPYIMDLESTNGTFLNHVQLDPARYYQLKRGDVLQFGASTREYVLLTAHTTRVE